MQEISAYELIKQKLHAIPNQRHKGSLFEKISKQFLQEHDSANEYESIDLWYDWKLRGNERDKGIDIVITTSNKEYIAVQCKFHQNSISYNDISPFLTQLLSGVGEIRFKKGIIISTSNLTSEALKAIEQIRSTGMGIDIDEITEEDFIYSRIDWEKFDPTKTEDEIPLCDKKRPRPHQTEAIEKTKEYFSDPKNARGKLIMACGTGKTYTSLKIMEALDPKITLFLAPSIALLSQTFREYVQEKSEPFYASIVCSDDKTGQSKKNKSKNEDNDDIKFSELPIKASTRLEDILSAYEKAQKENKRFIIFSTYQSALRIKEAQEAGLNGIDLIICDEAHRTVGAMYSTNERDDKNAFTLCHSDGNIKATKRLYMTATPKVYSESSKAKAKEKDNVIYSMDDAQTFGEEIYTLNFERAIALDLLTDYKVIILAVRSENLSGVTNSVNKKISQLEAKGTKLDKKLINNEFVCKIVGTHKGLAKQDVIALNDENQEDNDLKNKADTFVSQRAISFCKSIQTSKNIKDSFQTIMECYDEELKKKSFKNLKISIDHVDGTMNCKERLDKLENLNAFEPNICKVLSNARCLSEGVDVPALDSVIFFDGRSAMVDIIQAVGRVMRKAKNKKRGYIILPIALRESEINNLDEAVKNTNFQNIWKVLKALRSHDSSLVDEATFREKIKIFGSDDASNPDDEKELQKDKTQHQNDPKQAQKTLFDAILLQDLANAVYNVMPTKLGDRNYWENFAKKTGNIARTLNERLKELFGKNPEIFDNFLTSLRGNIHQNIKEEEALDMIISHIITKPIFDAIFGDNIQNPIAKALDKMVLKLSDLGLEGETKDLKNLYESVKTEAARAKSQKTQQELIKNLYNTFFKEAFRKQSEKLGIVYTPIEVVDFILRATNGILKKHFNTDFNDKNITIFDPFTGTGSFIARLLSKDNNFISDEALKEKFLNHLFAFDIVLLSYYIALINITQAAQNRDSSLKNFKNIALTDSLDYLEEKNDKGVFPLFADLKENQEIKNTLADQKIQVIIGNPPYSSGAKSENDNNQNLTHPKLEKWVYETYGKNSTAKVGATTRDTLIHSIRMASDLLKDKGVLGFVVNGSFINSKSADGFRKCVAKDFSHLYALNLRGNQRTSGEVSRKEGGKIFDSGSRATIAIIFFVKDKSVPNHTIFYYEVEDYLKREAKLNLLAGFENLDLVPFKEIVPNDKGDWINQRNDDFEKLIPLKRDLKLKIFNTIFDLNSNGVESGRDFWVYNFSPNALKQSVQNCIDTYNADLKRFNERFREAFKQRTKGVKKAELYKHLSDREITTDKTKISWTEGLKNKLIRNEILPESSMERVRLALYRPFNKQWLYWDKDLIKRQGRFSKIFPDKNARNVVINTTTRNFCSLIGDAIPFIGNANAYPLYYYDELGNRYNAISGYALNLFRRHYKDDSIVEEEIFYYIYAIFHHKGYLEKYKNSLAKEAPRIALSEDFKELSMLGKELAELHLNYENGEMHDSVKHNLLENAGMEGYYDVVKMTKKGDRIIYNHHITITQIPKKAFDYVVNGKSAIDWVIERYSITTDKDSLIENNPNHYAGGQYIFELLCRVITLSVKSVDLIEKISKKRFE
ncbi:DEAD/DEAH box helicase [Helicobacter pylori]|uniref:DEAD/DEAH box helicase n=1 Tax=Helicobacter pylori TaxID=210 RepID=UPI000EB417C1|nr:DEAD/DEAH box helicase [Helicobacter pylori]